MVQRIEREWSDNKIKCSDHVNDFFVIIRPPACTQGNPSPCLTNPTHDIKSVMPHKRDNCRN